MFWNRIRLLISQLRIAHAASFQKANSVIERRVCRHEVHTVYEPDLIHQCVYEQDLIHTVYELDLIHTVYEQELIHQCVWTVTQTHCVWRGPQTPVCVWRRPHTHCMNMTSYTLCMNRTSYLQTRLWIPALCLNIHPHLWSSMGTSIRTVHPHPWSSMGISIRTVLKRIAEPSMFFQYPIALYKR